MKLPDWHKLERACGILAEPIQENDRIVLWREAERHTGWQHWERIANVARAPIMVEQGIASIPATIVEAKQPIRGVFGQILQRFRKPTEQPGWLLPNGASAEQVGERRTDALLAWVLIAV